MNYKSKQHLTEAFTTLALSIGYVVFAFGNRAPNISNLQAYGKAILIFICVTAFANIAIQIIFHFLFSASIAVKASQKHEEHLVERTVESFLRFDERDRQINHRAGYIASFFMSIGFILSIVFLAFGGKPVIFLHILLAAFVLSLLAHSVMNVIVYGRDGSDE